METDPNRMAALMLGLPDVHVLKVEEDSMVRRVEMETAADVAHCPSCGDLAAPRDRRTVQQVGRPVFGRTPLITWKVRGWQCTTSNCPTDSWFEEIPAVAESTGFSEG